MEYVTLNNGVKMPQLGFGVFQIKDPAGSKSGRGKCILSAE